MKKPIFFPYVNVSALCGFILFFIMALTGCSSTLSGNATRNVTDDEFTDQMPPEQDYRINVKDILEIKVYPDEELHRELTVGSKGTINFPLLGEVQAEGLSVSNLERKLTTLLAKDYLVYPQVHIRVKQYHSMTVSMIGEVNRPGPYKLESEEGETTLLEAIAMAGGFSNVANIKKIKIIRIEGGEKKVYRINAEDIIKGKKKDFPLQANDIIVVEQSWF